MVSLGIDVGGTFIDFALAGSDESLLTHKILTNHQDIAGAVLHGLTELAQLRGQSLSHLIGELALIVHGTTVATNAVLTHSGNRTGLLTTRGTRDALEMRRGIKEEPLNNKFTGPPPLVPRKLRLPIDERIDAAGAILDSLNPDSMQDAIRVLSASGVESVAICLMHSYANSEHESKIVEAVGSQLPNVYVTASSEIMPQLGYYARVSTTVLNSYVGPLLSSYLMALAERLRANGYSGPLLIMNSTGGVMSPQEMARLPAAALVSGPAAGPVAGHRYADQHEAKGCVVADMGGTSFDISLVWDGEPLMTTEGSIGGYALGLPMLDIRTIGAGGGSIGWLDNGGLLHMGPKSASASPGPACYARGGTLPTCTDANVVLGFVDPDAFLGGRMRLDRRAAEDAIQRHIAAPLGTTIEDAAVAMFEVINANMATGIRDMIVDRGLDPRDLPLIIGGGAGPLHAGALAAELESSLVVIPRESSVLCAAGMLFSDIKHDLVRTCYVAVPALDREHWLALFRAMEEDGRKRLLAEGANPAGIEILFAADMRYNRQLHEITVALKRDEIERINAGELHALFDREHERLFGYFLPQHQLDLVNVRASCIGRLPKPELERRGKAHASKAQPKGARRAYVPLRQVFEAVPIYAGDEVGDGDIIDGPSIVEMPQTAVVVPEGFRLNCDTRGNLLLSPLHAGK